MNAATRVMAQGSVFQGEWAWIQFSKEKLIMMLLMLAVLVSAISVIYVKDMNRRLYSELHDDQAAAQRLDVDAGRLLLEQSTWGTPDRVQRIARERLKMAAPRRQRIFNSTRL